jgi:hypothetical protein
MIEDSLHLPPVSTTPVVHLELRISPLIFKKILNGSNGILRGLGETDSCKKTRSRKSRDSVPLKPLYPKITVSLTSGSAYILITHNNDKILAK